MDIMFSSVIGDYFSLYSITVIMVSALVSGVIFGWVYIFTQKAGVQDGVAFIIIFPVSVSIFTLLAKDSLPKAVAALGLICFLGLKSGSFFQKPHIYILLLRVRLCVRHRLHGPCHIRRHIYGSFPYYYIFLL